MLSTNGWLTNGKCSKYSDLTHCSHVDLRCAAAADQFASMLHSTASYMHNEAADSEQKLSS